MMMGGFMLRWVQDPKKNPTKEEEKAARSTQ